MALHAGRLRTRPGRLRPEQIEPFVVVAYRMLGELDPVLLSALLRVFPSIAA